MTSISHRPSGAEPQEFAIREAALADLPVMMAHRRAMWEAMKLGDAALLERLAEPTAAWTRRKLQAGEYRAWLMVDRDGRPVAGAGLLLQETCPGPRNPSGRAGCVMNVYTAPELRGRGLARRLMETILAWCRGNGYPTVTLHASDAGRPLYESLGFKPTNEMRLRPGEGEGEGR
ncbi:MAG TPA: GNAT family N-acetyltransferase [Planctomycetota bacterium]|nr:GNAT family N-acetyltransferase [Planctomycetota bacterium]